jgi:hypothetical protein
MAFTDTEKAQLLFFLGYSGFEDDGPAIRAINGLDSKEPTMGPIVRDILDKLARIDCEIMETIPLAQAIKDGSIELRAHYTIQHLWNMGRQLVSRLARFTKIQVSGDVFGPGGNERDGQGFFSGDPSEHRVNPEMGLPTTGSFFSGSGSQFGGSK